MDIWSHRKVRKAIHGRNHAKLTIQLTSVRTSDPPSQLYTRRASLLAAGPYSYHMQRYADRTARHARRMVLDAHHLHIPRTARDAADYVHAD
eukprot:scaffold142637_cov37-Tisochrysis_lutea.AAC.2